LPSKLLHEAKFSETKAEAQKLLQVFEQFQESEKKLSIRELLLCMKKINQLTGLNQSEALTILDSMVKDKPSTNAADILELQNIKETVNQQKDDHMRNVQNTENFISAYNRDIADFEVLKWSKDQLIELLPCLSDKTNIVDDVTNEWKSIKTNLEKEKEQLNDLCRKAQLIRKEFQKLKSSKILLIIDYL
jgi:hypothetical protein